MLQGHSRSVLGLSGGFRGFLGCLRGFHGRFEGIQGSSKEFYGRSRGFPRYFTDVLEGFGDFQGVSVAFESL